ncbi:NAD(P)H-binding protein [Nocardioides sp. CFH 31398]|uniref:NmrA family NAD(P)-binding protein n=1 Tax=Nocardioides sp. CFH 31398 TaxID=2919579 RepID=UPI001F06E811|nr:NAD(P)H-binding protein [Nocardioides sp. CFH 31398]MCH1865063.1 NAD(P)H-binding protein [Nocardioides sp. CFH 31398]
MIITTGATGRLGSLVVQELLRRVPADRVGVSVRDPDRAEHLARLGVRVRAGDFTDPDTLVRAFEGASRVLVVSAAIRGEAALAANTAALDAARTAGAQRIVYTSHQAASPDSLFAPQRVHAATETHLAGLGVPFTALRNGFYAGSLGLFVGDALRTGRLLAPADGPVSWTAHADLATAAATALTDDDPALDGVTPPLTAGAALDLEAVAARLGELSGTPVTRVVVPDDVWREQAVAAGMPPGAADFTLGMYAAARRGDFDVVDPTLGRLLGREPVAVDTAIGALVDR